MKIAVTHGILVTHLKALAHRIFEDTKEAFSSFFSGNNIHFTTWMFNPLLWTEEIYNE